MSNLGDWIRDKHKTQQALAEKLGVQQSRVSKWVKGESIPKAYQDALRDLKYKGPWPSEEASPAPRSGSPGAEGDYISREEHARTVGQLEGQIRMLERALENLAEAYRAHILKEPERAHPEGR